MTHLPSIIQGGMGVAISGWLLARAVASRGHLGVVSGTALDAVLVRRLQLGDAGGEIRRALGQFPDADVVTDLLSRYYVPGGTAAPSSPLPMYTATANDRRQSVAVAAGFVEVFLAKEGHAGRVGINFLEKIQLPAPATLYGALLAGVDYVLVGAGIPRDVPGLLDGLVGHEPVSLPLHVTGATPADEYVLTFDPRRVLSSPSWPPLRRPRFLAIVASATLAASLARHGGRVDGFVVEGPTAGGHNAPPRGPLTLSGEGEPVYGPRDAVDLGRMREIGLPFWLAGSCGTPEGLRRAQAEGAAGVQVGTLFALCDESGLDPSLRARVFDAVRRDEARVFTDSLASPTGFPFKVLRLEGTLSEAEVYASRPRRCDLGYLREIYRRPDGRPGYRCPGEPVAEYVRKGGRIEATLGRKCICNGLLATAALGLRRAEGPEPGIVTSGNDLHGVARLLDAGKAGYAAADVIAYLTEQPPQDGPNVRHRSPPLAEASGTGR